MMKNWGIITKAPDLCLLLKNQNLVIPGPHPPWPQAAETEQYCSLRCASFPVPTCLALVCSTHFTAALVRGTQTMFYNPWK